MKFVAEIRVCLLYSSPISFVNRTPPGVVAALLVTLYSTAWVACRCRVVRITRQEKQKNFIEEEVCTKEVDQRSGSNDCHLGEEVNTVIEETILGELVHNPNFVVEQLSTSGFIKSFNGSCDGSGFGINLEVDLAQALSKNLNKKGLLSLNQSGLVRQPSSVSKLLRNEKRKSKKKHSFRSVIFRPAAAAIARLDLSEGVTSPNNLLLDEAKTTIQLGKSLGINFNEKEDDVLNKIIELELKDRERSK
ncbi:unnamed protein product [Camellia sinensis]